MRFEVLKVVMMIKLTVFWDVMPCILVEICTHFGGTSYPHFQYRGVKKLLHKDTSSSFP
jgi:hypothetical protein